MSKFKFKIHILPINHFLVGFNYQTCFTDESMESGMDEFSLGLGLFGFSLIKFHK